MGADDSIEEHRKLEDWHRAELQRLGFSREQRQFLMALMDADELDLADVRDLIEKRRWTPEQAWLWAT